MDAFLLHPALVLAIDTEMRTSKTNRRRLLSELLVLVGLFPAIAISIGLEHVIHLIGKGRRVDVVGVLILAPNRRRRSNFSNMHIKDHGVDVASLLEETKGGADYGVRLQRKGNSSEAFGGGGFN
ncbi:hypothetical protein RHSIM_Rhsim02G0224600 [Rhododendron simsii]|uniref:Uncharacterized protein n=1 Tax=Rhododendron simsii TaxID=118357 RepID=A0A834LTE9_RHOSS|nr:hypothetical protein RHSIM_Rhsim02G0224600 [Rhododendron simsii]